MKEREPWDRAREKGESQKGRRNMRRGRGKGSVRRGIGEEEERGRDERREKLGWTGIPPQKRGKEAKKII